MKVVLTGASGFLGTYLLQSPFATQFDVINLHRKQLDLLNSKKIIPTLETLQPDVVIHLAAKTHIDRCQADQALSQKSPTWQVNVKASERIAQFCQKNKVKLIFMSTEAVYNGRQTTYTETDLPSGAMSFYGKSKAAAEKRIQKIHDNVAILRAVIAYHPTVSKNMYTAFKNRLEKQQTVRAVTDQFFTPTYLGDIAEVLPILIRRDLRGVFHITPSQKSTPYQFAQQLADKFHYDQNLIKPVTLVDFFGPEKAKLRLKHACLESQQSQKILGLHFHQLGDVLNEL